MGPDRDVGLGPAGAWAWGQPGRNESGVHGIGSSSREHGHGLWLLEHATTGEFVGDCGLTFQEVGGRMEVEIGYHVRRSLQGRGYATEAALAVRDFARDVLGLHRLVAIIDPGNAPSRRVAQRIGLTFEQEVGWSGKRVLVYAGPI